MVAAPKHREPSAPPPPRPAPGGGAGRALVVLLLSLLVHVSLWSWLSPYLDGWSTSMQEPPVAIRVLSADDPDGVDPQRLAELDALLPLVQPEQPAAEEEEEPEEEPPRDLRGQIVETPPPDEPKRPDQADYLAEHDNSVPEETRSERFKINPEVLANRWSEESRYQMEDAIDVGATKASTGATAGGQTDDAPGKGAPKSLLPSQYALTNKAGVAAPTMASSRTQALSGAPQNDLLDEKRGDTVALNTRQFFGAEYLNRIRRQVNLYWQQNIDNLPSSVRLSKSRYVTVLDVVLTADGVLESVEILSSSGNEPVDLCVVNAFRVAGPFRNPPAQLISKDGRVYLPDFGFTLEVGHARLPYQGIDPRAGVQFPGIMRAPR